MRVDVLSKLPRMLLREGVRFLNQSGMLPDYTNYHKVNDQWVHKITGEPYVRELKETNIFDANLVSSKTTNGDHFVMLDLDFDCALVPSSNEEHWHLYMDKRLNEDDMDKLVNTLTEVGILNKGVKACQWDVDKQLTLRLPWVRKGNEQPMSEQVWDVDSLQNDSGQPPVQPPSELF